MILYREQVDDNTLHHKSTSEDIWNLFILPGIDPGAFTTETSAV